jgi:hypothetical protein
MLLPIDPAHESRSVIDCTNGAQNGEQTRAAAL